MTLIFKRKGCDMIRIPDPSGRDICSYCKAASDCATITHDLEVFQILNHLQEPVREPKKEISVI